MLTPPKAGPGTEGILPARSRKPRCRGEPRARFLGARASRPPRARRIPAMPRKRRRPEQTKRQQCRAPAPKCLPRRRRGPGPRASCPHVPASRDVGRKARPPPAAPPPPQSQDARARRTRQPRRRRKLPGREGVSPAPGAADPRNAPQPPPDRRRPERPKRQQCRAPAPKCLPRRRRGPGPRASCPHVPASRDVGGSHGPASRVRGRLARTFAAQAPPSAELRETPAIPGETRRLRPRRTSVRPSRLTFARQRTNMHPPAGAEEES